MNQSSPAIPGGEQLALVERRTASGRKSRANTGMTEAQLLAAVRQLARYRGWWIYHTAISRGSDSGWPDLAMINPRHRRFLAVELKSEHGKLTPDQISWLDALDQCGIETAVWRPADLATTIPQILRGTPTRWRTAP